MPCGGSMTLSALYLNNQSIKAFNKKMKNALLIATMEWIKISMERLIQQLICLHILSSPDLFR